MESTRRPFDRSLSKEPGLKKLRLSQDSAAPDRISNGRAGFVQRPVAAAASNSGGIGSRLQRDRDSDSSGSVRGPYQDRNQELVNQYKTALAELTFNSKPIITNLTIIAGENVVAAKAIAATICTNIIEVPSEQKLPSLYLLDSIVKNIGKDYIKYFAPRIPEVFCEAYRQVDPSVHQGMRHLFGTWKGVFPPQSLQMIEKELGFTSTVNGSSTGTSRLDSQVQRPAQSIHVNPKYLEARQRLQSTRARGAGSDVNGALDTQAQGATSISSERSWPDPYAKVKQDFSTRANGVSRSWKNSEEEEYMWDDMNSRPTDKTLDFGSQIGRPYNMHNIGSRIGDNASADSLSTELSHVAPGTRASLSWSQELHPSDERMFSGSGKNSSGNSEGYSSGWENSENLMGKTSFQPQLGPAHIEAPVKFSTNVMPGPKVSVTQQRQAFGAASSSTKASINQRPPPSFPARSLNQQSTTTSERNQVSTGPPTDPRRASVLRNTGSRDQFSHDSLPPPSQDVYQANTQRLQPQSLRTSSSVPSRQRLQPQSIQTSSSVLPPLLQTKHVPYTEQRKVDVSEFKSFGEGRSLLPSQISRPESLSMVGNSSSDQSNPLSVDSPEQSITSSLLAAVVKSGVLGDSALTGSSTKVESLEVGSGLPLGGVQLSIPSGSPSNISSPSALHGMGLPPGLSQKKLEQQPLRTGPAPSSLPSIVLGQTASVVNSNSIPVSSLLSTLVAKGLILSSNSESLGLVSTRKPDQPLDRDPGVTSTSSSPITSVAVANEKPLLSIKVEPSSFEPAVKACDGLSESITEIKNLIGFEFRPNIVRNLHPEVVDDLLSELPYNCCMCGLRLKLQEQLDRHIEWHELKAPQSSPSAATSRSWYINAVDWVAGVGQFPGNSPSDLLVESDETSETSEEMVPADESQCACILCGELFEDFYSLERNEWMFKGAVYLTIPSSELHEIAGIRNDSVSLNPIVHAICMKEDSVRDLRKAYDVKLGLGAWDDSFGTEKCSMKHCGSNARLAWRFTM